jgi:hypothetical protein
MICDFVEGGESFSLFRKSQVKYKQHKKVLRILGLTMRTEISKSSRKILCSRDCASYRIPPQAGYYLSRS